mgnify:CR=1 FL=1
MTREVALDEAAADRALRVLVGEDRRAEVVDPRRPEEEALLAAGLGRGLGETLAVLMLAGNSPVFPGDLLGRRAGVSRDGANFLERAVVVFAAPGFYNAPQTIDDLIEFVVGRCLDQLGIEPAAHPRAAAAGAN